MESQNTRLRAANIALLVTSSLLVVAVRTFAAPCAETSDGFMSCHWAGEAVFGVGVALIAMSLLALFVGDARARAGIAGAAAIVGLLAFEIPGRLISLCMMETMQCQTVMKPAVRIIAVLIVMSAAAVVSAARETSEN